MTEIDWTSPKPITLEHTHARLEPLSLQHADDLFEAGRDAEIWRYLPAAAAGDVAEIVALIEGALEELAAGRQIPFAIVDRARTGGGVDSLSRYSTGEPGDRDWLDVDRDGVSTDGDQ